MNLVTGATGILGSHVVLALLQDGQEVVACRKDASDLSKINRLFSYYTKDHLALLDKIKWRSVDIEDAFSIEDALEGITHVYHCAGFVSFHSKDRKRLLEINEKGTRNIVNACLLKNINSLCHVSSLATLNNLDYTAPLTEEVFWKRSGMESDYAISKYNAEREVWRGIEEGLNAVIVNPGVIIGPGFKNQSSAKIFETGFKGNKFYSDGTTGYISAVDAAKIMVGLMKKKLYNNRYILVEGNYTYKHIFTTVNQYFNQPAPNIKVNRFVLNVGRFFEWVWSKISGRERLLSRAVINSAFNKQRYSNQKVRDALNHNFLPIDNALEFASKMYLVEHQKQGSSL